MTPIFMQKEAGLTNLCNEPLICDLCGLYDVPFFAPFKVGWGKGEVVG
jgi:hypothetical protein